MERILRTNRRYPLGDFKYITLEDVISEIPDNLALNSEFAGTLQFIQLVGFEIAYRRYIRLINDLPYTVGVDEAIETLETLKTEEMEKIKGFLNGQSLDNDQPQIKEE